ncbi:MAG: adenylate/guanylate cyclase domain-containing protein, partial [Longimicrobiales bacterium]
MLFSGPGHASRAVSTAMEMQTANRRFAAVRLQGSAPVRMKMSIGVHSGTFWSATAGLPGLRMQHFILGADANYVARVEAGAAAGQVLISGSTQRLLEGCLTEPIEEFYRVLRVQRAVRERHGLADPALQPLYHRLMSYLPPAVASGIKVPGSSVGFEGEHRKVAVAFVHVLGVEEVLESQGPAALLADMQAYVANVARLVDQYGGYLAGNDIYTTGTKLILVFGAPVAHEDDSTNAVRVALELRNLISSEGIRLRQRVGINSGFVFATDVGTAYRREFTVMGDAVNLAARLMSAAEPGEILISRKTADDAAQAIVVREREPIQVKGKRAPVAVCSVEAQRTAAPARSVDVQGELIGREAEQGVLRAACAGVEAGHGSCVVVSGEAGIGKSRLVLDFLQYLSA